MNGLGVVCRNAWMVNRYGILVVHPPVSQKWTKAGNAPVCRIFLPLFCIPHAIDYFPLSPIKILFLFFRLLQRISCLKETFPIPVIVEELLAVLDCCYYCCWGWEQSCCLQLQLHLAKGPAQWAGSFAVAELRSVWKDLCVRFVLVLVVVLLVVVAPWSSWEAPSPQRCCHYCCCCCYCCCLFFSSVVGTIGIVFCP